MEQTDCSETSTHKIQTPGNHPQIRTHHSVHGESAKSRITHVLSTHKIGRCIQTKPGDLSPLWNSRIHTVPLQACYIVTSTSQAPPFPTFF